MNSSTDDGNIHGLDGGGADGAVISDGADGTDVGSNPIWVMGATSVLIDSSRGIVPIVMGKLTSKLNDIPGVITLKQRL